jgi:hypothetical protein
MEVGVWDHRCCFYISFIALHSSTHPQAQAIQECQKLPPSQATPKLVKAPIAGVRLNKHPTSQFIFRNFHALPLPILHVLPPLPAPPPTGGLCPQLGTVPLSASLQLHAGGPRLGVLVGAVGDHAQGGEVEGGQGAQGAATTATTATAWDWGEHKGVARGGWGAGGGDEGGAHSGSAGAS